MIICTTATISNLPYVLELAHSVRKHFADAKFVLGLAEDHVPELVAHSSLIDQTILAKDLDIPDFKRFMFKLTPPLCKNTLKAQLMRHILRSDAWADVLVYVDCWTKFFGPIPEALQLLDHYSIVLTPHIIDASESDSCEKEWKLLNDGTLYAGFIAVKQSDEANHFLLWWSDKLNRDIRDPNGSDFWGQKWLNVANVLYHVGILRHPGYQLSLWNFHEKSRKIVSVDGHEVMLAGGPLRLMNFSNENNAFEHYAGLLAEHQSRHVRRLKELYEMDLLTKDYYGLVYAGWSYDHYDSGEKIEEHVRHKYRNVSKERVPSNPYQWSNERLVDLIDGYEGGRPV